MDKKLLADFSRIIRDIESKNLYKEADILNNCLVRLAQSTEDINTLQMDDVPEAVTLENNVNKNESTDFITESNDFSNKVADFSKKAADIVSTGRKIDSMELEQLNKIIEQAKKLISMNEASNQELSIIQKTLDQFVSFKNKVINL
jgi:hypothetical protein